MPTAVFSIESVLTTGSNLSISANESVGEGRILYDALKSQYRIVIMSDHPDSDAVKSWLIRERLSGFAFVYGYDRSSGLSPAEWKVAKIRELQSHGHNIGFYIDGNPETVRHVVELGINAILVAYSGKLPGLYGREREITPWYDLVATVEEHAMLRAAVAAEDDDDA